MDFNEAYKKMIEKNNNNDNEEIDQDKSEYKHRLKQNKIEYLSKNERDRKNLENKKDVVDDKKKKEKHLKFIKIISSD